MTTPPIAQHDVTVYLGDALDVLRSLPAESVQCVVTSPPYYGLRDYGVDGQLGLEASPAEYVAAIVGVFAEARRVLAGDGVLFLNLGDSYSAGAVARHNTNVPNKNRDGSRDAKVEEFGTRFTPPPETHGIPAKNLLGIPWRVAFALQDDGWTLRNAIIWAKPNAMPESVTDRLSTRYEHVFLFSKSRKYWFDLGPIREPLTYPDAADASRVFAGRTKAMRDGKMGSDARRTGNTYTRSGHDEGRNPGDVWTIPTSPFHGAHFACMPPALARRCILAGCPEGGTVLDPFTGSGTTAMVTRSLGRRFVGAELNPDYLRIIEQRIGPEPLQFETSVTA